MIAVSTGQILSCILIVSAGIALRCALWYRPRQREEGELDGRLAKLRDERDGIAADRDAIRDELDDVKSSFEVVSQEFEAVSQEFEVVSQERKQLHESLQSQEEGYDHLQGEYDSLRSEYDMLRDASNTLELDSRRQCEAVGEIESTLIQLQQEQSRSRLAYEQAESRCSSLTSDLSVAQDTIATLQGDFQDVSTLRSDLDRSRSDCDALQLSLEQSRETIVRLEVDAHFTNQLSEKQATLQQSLKESSQRAEVLASERDEIAVQLERVEVEASGLRDEMAQIQNRVGQIQIERDRAIDELKHARFELEHSVEDRDAIAAELCAAEEANKRAEEALAQMSADVELLRQLRESQSSLQVTVAESRDKLDSLASENSHLTACLDDTQQRASALDTQVTQLRFDVARSQEANRQLRDEKSEDIKNLEIERAGRVANDARCSNLAEETGQLRSETEGLRLETERLRAGTEELELASHQWQSEVTELRAKKEELTKALSHEATLRQSLEAQCVDIEAKLQSRTDELTSVEQELQRLLADERVGRSSDRENFHATEAALEQQVSELEGQIAKLQTAKLTAENELNEERDQRDLLERAWHRDTDELRLQRERALVDLEDERGTHQLRESSLREDIESLGRQQADLESRMLSIHSEREQMERDYQLRLTDVSCDKDRLTHELEEARQQSQRLEYDLSNQLSELNREKDYYISAFSREQNARAKMEEALRLHEATLKRLQADSVSLESLLERQVAVQSSLKENAEQLRRGRVEELDRVQETPTVLSFNVAKDTLRPNSDGTEARRDRSLGRVYDQRPLGFDDLKLISGISEILEQKLNELGIYTYEQITNWDDSHIREFSKRLAFKDRIERDRWVQQASKLHQQHGVRVA